MADPFPIPDRLDAVLDDIWQRLGRGSADRRSPLHTPVVGSVDTRGVVQQRVMVLRKVDRNAALLRFHTDVRSAKVSEVGLPVAVIGYDASAKIQIRATGAATVLTTGGDVDAAWAATTPSGRRSYLTTLPPGTSVAAATSGLPGEIEARTPDVDQTLSGRANFALLVIALDRLEWLHLAHDGHRRAGFERNGAEWRGNWLIP